MVRHLPPLARPQDQDIADRLLKRAVWNEAGCLIWTGARSGRGLYGSISVKKWAPPGRNYLHQRTHRVAYELFVGPVPDGLEIDHTCHNRSDCDLGQDCPHRLCLNPAHLEPATHAANVLRGTSPAARYAVATHCKRGHEFVEHLTIRTAKGGRACYLCKAGYRAQHSAERLTAKASSSRKDA